MRVATLLAVCFLALSKMAPAALVDNLELYYNFNNDTLTAGGIIDLSGNNRNGSPFDNSASASVGLSFSSDVPSALGSGNSLQFTGIDSIRAAAWTGIAGSGVRTVAMWVRTTTNVGASFVEWGNNSAAGNRFGFRVENATNQPTAGTSLIGGIRTEINGDYRTSAAGGPVINNNVWHHIATVYDPSGAGGTKLESVTLYVDGVAVSVADNTTTTTLNTILLNNVAIGGTSSGVNNTVFTGSLDEVGIWSRALSPAEIGQLAAGVVPIPEPGTIPLLLLGTVGLLAWVHLARR